MEERFVIKRKDFKKLERYAENIYNTAVVIDYFCSSQKEYEELYNLAPVVKNLRRDADQVNAFFMWIVAVCLLQIFVLYKPSY